MHPIPCIPCIPACLAGCSHANAPRGAVPSAAGGRGRPGPTRRRAKRGRAGPQRPQLHAAGPPRRRAKRGLAPQGRAVRPGGACPPFAVRRAPPCKTNPSAPCETKPSPPSSRPSCKTITVHGVRARSPAPPRKRGQAPARQEACRYGARPLFRGSLRPSRLRLSRLRIPADPFLHAFAAVCEGVNGYAKRSQPAHAGQRQPVTGQQIPRPFAALQTRKILALSRMCPGPQTAITSIGAVVGATAQSKIENRNWERAPPARRTPPAPRRPPGPLHHGFADRQGNSPPASPTSSPPDGYDSQFPLSASGRHDPTPKSKLRARSSVTGGPRSSSWRDAKKVAVHAVPPGV